jgi:predicted dehydrogenase
MNGMAKVFKVGLAGLGAMGRGHLEQYLRLMREGAPVKLVALCDVDKGRFEAAAAGTLNIEGVGKDKVDFSQFNLYTDIDEMIAKEALDYVDLVLPTYLHAEMSIRAMRAGLDALCEKPMALSPEECQKIIDVQRETGKQMMIAQCLRFWPAYETLKEYVDQGTFGKVTCAYFARHGGTPRGSFEEWLLDEKRSGGCLLDQHVHDVDMVGWLFGVPEAVSCRGVNMIPGAGFDAVSTNYRYADDKVINTQDDWCLNGKGVGFQMLFRVDFEKGQLIFDGGKLIVNPNDEPALQLDLPADNGYYREIRYFLDRLADRRPIQTAPLASTRDTIRIATAERLSAQRKGAWVELSEV